MEIKELNINEYKNKPIHVSYKTNFVYEIVEKKKKSCSLWV